jgi:signal transduction histidine kinase
MSGETGTSRAGERRVLGLPPRIALGFAAALVSLVAASVFSSAALRARAETSELLRHGAAAQLAIEELESALLVADASLDAYVGTRDPRHRERHDRAYGMIGPALRDLERLIAEHGDEQEVATTLSGAILQARREMRQAIALADRGDFPAATALRAREGALDLRRARGRLEALEELERAQALAHEGKHARTILLSNLIFGAAHLALLVLIALAARLVAGEIRSREEQETARERAMNVQRQLLGVVSHDLRNPLAGIMTAAAALSRGLHAPDQQQLAGRVVSAGRRMEGLIRDLLDWSRVNGGAEIPVKLCDADLHDVCRRVLNELGERHRERLRLSAEGDTWATFDPERMEQVVTNLVGNALKYTPAETPVTVRVRGEPAAVRLEVKDEGPGIPADAQARIFEPFRRGTTGFAPAGEGTGLGLFIVRELTAAQHGRVELDSAPGRGTTFVLTLPRSAAQVRRLRGLLARVG